ncbi:putative T7SS-secreted protein [Streptomyces boninensis]|uniref:putative T7SS-secreted protein n=1 Tax=Streptomyces boninensis TaxID=2039455 RepID=UPI003B2212EF
MPSWSDFVPDPVEDAVDKGKEAVGEGIEWGGGKVADGMDYVGWDSGAKWTREKSGAVANRLGADVAELQLGETDDPTKLIYGSPSKLTTAAKQLRAFDKALSQVGNGLKGLDAQELKGEAAEAFRTKKNLQPPRWFKAGGACETAAKALDDFAGTVKWAQGQAREAIEKYKAAQKATSSAFDGWESSRLAYNFAVLKFNGMSAKEQAANPLPAQPGDFTDPGKEQREAAEQMLAEARRQRNEAQERVAAQVRTAADEAPPMPSYRQQLAAGQLQGMVEGEHRLGGVLKSGADAVKFIRGINPIDPYNATHPAQYLTGLSDTAAGLVLAANDPVGIGKQMVTDYMRDPEEGKGRLIGDGLLAVGTGGAGAGAKAANTAKRLSEMANKARGGLKRHGPDGPSRTDGQRPHQGTDPVDLATGRMFLPQTDVNLPAAGLGLAFTRRVESGWNLGQWFGPSWTSTLDERLEIDPEGVCFVGADGATLAFPHPAPGQPVTPVSGPRKLLARNPDGAYAVHDPITGHTRFFTAPGGAEPGGDGTARIEEINDRAGHSITFTWDDASGAPVEIAHSGGYRLRFDVAGDRVTELVLAGAAADGSDLTLVTYGYTRGDLTTVTQASGGTLSFEYDDARRVTAWIDSNDSRYDYVYDDEDRVIAEGGAGGHFQLRLSYDETDPTTGHQITKLTTPEGHITRHQVNERAQIVAITDPLGNVVRTEYDATGAATARTDELGRTTRLSYDERGRLTSVTRPDGSHMAATYPDTPGGPLEVQGADGAVWRQEYDDSGNRLTATNPAGAITQYSYDTRGHLASVTNALGHTTTVRSNCAGLPVEVTDPLGATTRYERDAFGRVVRATDPLGATTRLEWTVEGRLARRTGPDGATESWTYDGEGNCTSHADAAGGVTRFEYTHFDVLSARTGQDGARYAFDYDRELRLTQVTGPSGLTWDYTYDRAGRLVAESDFDDREVQYELDATGQLLARTTSTGERITLEYDALGRTIRKHTPDGETSYGYDAAGRLLEAIGPSASVIYQRDRLGRVKAEMVDSRVTAYAYDVAGWRRRRVTPMGSVTTYDYDAAGRRISAGINGHAVAFEYDAAGRETRRGIDQALTLQSVWDETGRLTQQSVTTGSRRLQHRAYTYRADGYLTSVDDALNGRATFDLDELGRVTGVAGAAGWTESYAYDQLGNVLTAAWPAEHAQQEASGERAYTGTRIKRAGNLRYEYDSAGRLIRRTKTRLSKKADTWHFTYNSEDQLIGVETPDGTRWRYRYDPLGRRVSKERLASDGAGVTERVDFTWDGPTLIEQTTQAPELPHPVTVTWEHKGFRPIAQTERLTDNATQAEIDARFFAIATDLVGTPRELISESGEVAWRTRTTLWGTTAWSRESAAWCPLRFPGQYHDPETGLHYNHHRYYDPTTARYTTPDPLGLIAAPNQVTYVHNAHTWADPLGLAPYRELREGHTSQPGFKRDPYHPDVVESRIRDMRELYNVEPLPSPVRLPDMIGANGTQVVSHTTWLHGQYRIDVENPNPGQRPGQLHFQDQANPDVKYQYNFDTGRFEGMPPRLQDQLMDNDRFRAGIVQGLAYLGME